MGSLNRQPRREKNQFLRELEEYEQDKIDEHCKRDEFLLDEYTPGSSFRKVF